MPILRAAITPLNQLVGVIAYCKSGRTIDSGRLCSTSAQGRYADAEPLYKQALAIVKKALGPAHPDVAMSLENYAHLLRATGRSTEAAKMEARAKAIRVKHAQDN